MLSHDELRLRFKWLQLAALVVLITFVWGFFLNAYANRFLLGHVVFMFIPDDRFNDLVNLVKFSKNLDPFHYANAFYLPLTYFIVYPLQFISSKVLVMLSTLFFAASMYWYLLSRLSVFREVASKIEIYTVVTLLVCLSYPMMMVFDRANIESLLIVLTVLFFFYFEKKKYGASAMILSIPCVLKIYPLIFLVLYLKHRRYKEIFFVLVLTAILILVPFALLKGGLAINIQHYLHLNVVTYDNNNSNMFSSSVFSYVKMILSAAAHKNLFNFQYWVHEIYYFYIVFCFALAAFVTYFISRYDVVFWKQVFLLVLLMIMLPPVSYDYKLPYLFIPYCLFLTSGHKCNVKVYNCLFIILFVNKICLYAGIDSTLISFNGFINLLTMCFGLFYVVYEQFKSKLVAGDLT